MLESMLIDLQGTTLPTDPEAALATIGIIGVTAHFWPGSRRMVTAWGDKAQLEELRLLVAGRHYRPDQQPFDFEDE